MYFLIFVYIIPICECIPLGRTYCPAVGMDFYKAFFFTWQLEKRCQAFEGTLEHAISQPNEKTNIWQNFRW